MKISKRRFTLLKNSNLNALALFCLKSLPNLVYQSYHVQSPSISLLKRWHYYTLIPLFKMKYLIQPFAWLSSYEDSWVLTRQQHNCWLENLELRWYSVNCESCLVSVINANFYRKTSVSKERICYFKLGNLIIQLLFLQFYFPPLPLKRWTQCSRTLFVNWSF